MKEEPLDFKLIEMLNTPICKMDGKDLVYLIKGVLSEQLDNPSVSSEEEKKHYVFGFKGIAQLFGCSISTASRIKRSGVIDDAITQVGRKILIDADKALALVKEKNRSQRYQEWIAERQQLFERIKEWEDESVGIHK